MDIATPQLKRLAILDQLLALWIILAMGIGKFQSLLTPNSPPRRDESKVSELREADASLEMVGN